MPATQVFFAPLQPSIDSSPAVRENLAGVFDSIKKDTASQRIFYGTRTEDGALVGLLDWDSVEAHKAFRGTQNYVPVRAGLSKLLGGRPLDYHVAFQTAPADAKVAGPGIMSEMVAYHFPPDYSGAMQEDFLQRRLGPYWKAIAGREGGGLLGALGGWSIERDVNADGAPSRVFLAVLGWTDMVHHLDIRCADEYMDTIGAVKSAPQLIRCETSHVFFNEA